MKCSRLLFLAVLLLSGLAANAQAPAPKPASAGSAASKPAASGKSTTPVTKAASAGTSSPLDINTASPDQLMQLPGIGQAYSKRIIDGRPYTAKNQLLSRGILPKATYDGVAGQIIAHRPAK